jgi:hypothetical protein
VTATGSFTLTIDAVEKKPSFTSATSDKFMVNTSDSFTFTTNPFTYPIPTFELIGYPTGLTFTDEGNGTAVLSGTPLSISSGVYDLVLTATNPLGTAEQRFKLTVGN